MERAKRPYSIQKRPTSKKNRSVYYIQFRDPETSRYLTAVSSGKSSKSEAQNWADEQIKTGKVIASDKKGMLLETYARDFWDWDKSAYVKGKLARGQRIGRTHVEKSAGFMAFTKASRASRLPRELSWKRTYSAQRSSSPVRGRRGSA